VRVEAVAKDGTRHDTSFNSEVELSNTSTVATKGFYEDIHQLLYQQTPKTPTNNLMKRQTGLSLILKNNSLDVSF